MTYLSHQCSHIESFKSIRVAYKHFHLASSTCFEPIYPNTEVNARREAENKMEKYNSCCIRHM